MLKNKTSLSKKMNCLRSKTATNFSKTPKVILANQSKGMLQSILSEIANESAKEEDRCSDDLVSEGGSDSEGSSDDLEFSVLKGVVSGTDSGNISRFRRFKSKGEGKGEVQEEKRIKHSRSLVTEVE